jgi:putative flippase GtrA
MADKKKFIAELRETARFMLSSMFASIIDYTAYILMYEVFKADINLCYTVAKGVGATENFFCNNFIVFRRKGKKGILKRFVIFMLTVVIIAIIGNFIIAALHEKLLIPAVYAKILTDTATFLLSFTSQKFLIFKEEGIKSSYSRKTEVPVRNFREHN